MFERYPFIVPIFFVWLPIFLATVIIFYTTFGLSRRPILNRVFMMRLNSLTLFVVALFIMVSGIVQLLGVSKIMFGQPLKYWHALAGYVFILAALNHMAIHIKDIYRYIFKSRPKAPPPPPSGNQP